jgi:high-affinity iron transporter
VLGSAVIVFREVLEAALIIAVVMGASRGVLERGRWILAGIVLGIAGACVVAAFAGQIANGLEGRGQELFNAGVLLAAVAMLAWHNVWMSAHGRKLAQDMQHLGRDVTIGAKPLSAMLAVTALAVLREGAETVLFLYGLAAGGAGALSLVGGSVIGLSAGALLGVLLYQGLLRIPVARFFSVTGWIVLLLAAGLAASAADYLEQAGILPALIAQVWDSSGILDQKSIFGQTLHVLIGYQDRPSGIALLTYILTLVTIGALMRLARGGDTLSARTVPASGSP